MDYNVLENNLSGIDSRTKIAEDLEDARDALANAVKNLNGSMVITYENEKSLSEIGPISKGSSDVLIPHGARYAKMYMQGKNVFVDFIDSSNRRIMKQQFRMSQRMDVNTILMSYFDQKYAVMEKRK